MKLRSLLNQFVGYYLYINLLLFIIAGVPYVIHATSMDVAEGDEWCYFIGTEELPFKWNHIGFDKHDKDWIKGRTGIGHMVIREQVHNWTI